MDFTPRPEPKGRFFAELESARGIAALFVAGYHCAHSPVLIAGSERPLYTLGESHWTWALLREFHHLVVMGTAGPHLGVLFFFILSGFVLTNSLHQGPQATAGRASARFFLARFLRIYPAVVATILIFWGVYAFTGFSFDPSIYTARSLLLNFALLRTNIDGAMWTLQVEFLALPLIFLAFLLQSRLGLWATSLLVLALTALAFSGWWVRLIPSPSRTGWLYTFLFGVMAYHLGRRIVPALRQRMATIVLVVSVLIFFLIGLLIRKQWETIGTTLAGAAIVAVLAFGPTLPATALLRARPIRFLGRVSYSLYLLHPLTLPIIAKPQALFGGWVERGVPAILISLGLWFVTVVVILPLAWFMYRMVEVPFIRLGKRWRGGARRTAR